ncbi:MAG: DsbA family protein [Sandaracinaceae bacterium]
MSAPLAIEVVSDVVCPWCFIGEHRLAQALVRVGIAADVRFTPFLLDPTTPPEGADLRERLRAKYQLEPEVMFDRVERAAAESGLVLDFDRVERSVDTLRAHTLLRRARARGTQVALARALFEAYFVEGRDVGAEPVLVELASRHGFATDEARALLADPAELERTRAEAAAQGRRGIRGVPYFVFRDRYAVSGAQPVDVLVNVLERVQREPVE